MHAGGDEAIHHRGFCRRPVAWLRWPKSLSQANDGEDADRADGRAQKTRRVSLESKLPPLMVVVGEVFRHEETEPRRGAGEPEKQQPPARGKAVSPERGMAVKVRAAGEQAREVEGKKNGLLPIEAFHEGENDASGDGGDGEPPCRSDSPLQAARKDDEQRAGETGEEVRGLDEGQRN